HGRAPGLASAELPLDRREPLLDALEERVLLALRDEDALGLELRAHDAVDAVVPLASKRHVELHVRDELTHERVVVEPAVLDERRPAATHQSADARELERVAHDEG